jgi:hypothetical protein
MQESGNGPEYGSEDRERWTQLYNNTSQVFNQVRKDRQTGDWEKRLRAIEEYRKTRKELKGHEQALHD